MVRAWISLMTIGALVLAPGCARHRAVEAAPPGEPSADYELGRREGAAAALDRSTAAPSIAGGTRGFCVIPCATANCLSNAFAYRWSIGPIGFSTAQETEIPGPGSTKSRRIPRPPAAETRSPDYLAGWNAGYAEVWTQRANQARKRGFATGVVVFAASVLAAGIVILESNGR